MRSGPTTKSKTTQDLVKHKRTKTAIEVLTGAITLEQAVRQLNQPQDKENPTEPSKPG